MKKNRLNLSEKFFPIYRGRTPQGQWVTGAYIPAILNSGLTKTPQIFDGKTFHSVQYSTIGRSVGKCDKNADLIFEDDVLKFTYSDEDGESVEYMLICWSFEISGFVMYSNQSDLPVDIDNGISDGEIIGNIYDNPELLELFEKTVDFSGDSCLVDGFKQCYDVVKAVYPINTTVNAGVDVHTLVKEKFKQQYDKYFMNFLDWNDVDGVLDYLYGIRMTHGADVSEIIKLIESNCGGAA